MKTALLTVILIGIPAASAADLPLDCGLVPDWRQKGERHEFVADNLFDYMNGNAEGYVIYGFQKLTGITCVSGAKQIIIDFSELESPAMAYGIFAANRHPHFGVKPIGIEGQVMPRRSTFAKGIYYVELAASGADDLTAELEAFATAIAAKLEGTTEKPPETGWFPTEGLDPASVRLVPQSVLGLRALKQGYMAKYAYGRAFLVTEATPDSASAVFEQLRKRIGETSEVAAGDAAFVGKDRYLGTMCVVRKGSRVFGFSDLAEGEDAAARASAMASRVP